MLDPVSILNVIGFAFQCSELLIGGIAQFKNQKKSYKGCEARLREYQLALQNCSMNMLGWCTTWGFKGNTQKFSDETLAKFWGPADFKKVQDLLQDITALSNTIQERLTGKSI